MRYVANLAKEFGIEMKKEDFVSETFDEMFKKMKSREQALIEFSSYIAHEFRNSIAAIVGLARLIEKGKKPASAITKECRVMEELISRLLEYSKPLKPLLASVDIVNLIDDAITKAAVPSRISLTKKLVNDMPAVYGDYDLLLLALVNLLKNGIEAIQGEGHIDIHATHDDNFVTMSITDTGAGIDERDIERIFSPFYSRKEAGLGLGLAYVKRIMEIHNGRVDVETQKGEGSTFILKFPLAKS
jgi:signal transduction histidine kinase